MLTNLQTRFWSAAENQATEHGFAFTPGCESLLRELIDQGISRITDEIFFMYDRRQKCSPMIIQLPSIGRRRLVNKVSFNILTVFKVFRDFVN